jgi:hypothetical protein
MHGIHDVFPPDKVDSNDPISETKLKRGQGIYNTRKMLVGFDFDWKGKTMWLESAKRDLKDGYGQGHEGLPEYLTVNSNPRLQNSAIPSHVFRRDGVCCHRTTGYCDNDQPMFTFSITSQS